MIKKILFILAVSFGMAASAQTLKVGLVDSNAIIAAMPGTADAQKAVQELQKKYEIQYNGLRDELQLLADKIQNTKEDELPAIRERNLKEFQNKQQTMQQFEEQVMQKLQEEQMKQMQPVLTAIRNAIESVGRENGFSLIQDNNPQLTLYYAAPVEDITPLVKAKLNLK